MPETSRVANVAWVALAVFLAVGTLVFPPYAIGLFFVARRFRRVMRERRHERLAPATAPRSLTEHYRQSLYRS